jgi:hypothetical protein
MKYGHCVAGGIVAHYLLYLTSTQKFKGSGMTEHNGAEI